MSGATPVVRSDGICGAVPAVRSDGICGAVPAIRFDGICKQFGAVRANDGVGFDVAAGSIHGVVGENGAGKSTLMSILYGYYQADAGQISLGGQPVRIGHSQDAIKLGIGMVHQHFMLVDDFTVLDNVMLGAEGGALLGTQQKLARQRLVELAAQYRLDVDPQARVGDLSVGAQQRVEILKLLFRGAQILILDEPTAVLTPQEADSLFEILRLFRAQGKTIILITHKLQEIFAITDRVTVMRAGRVVGEVDTARSSRAELAAMMIGRQLDSDLSRRPCVPGERVLSVRELNLPSREGRHGGQALHGIDFDLHAGEIVAIAGVSGNGQTELLEVLSGMRLIGSGRIDYLGQPLPYAGRRHADGLPRLFRELGIAHAPEDRLREGLVKDYSVALNGALGHQGDAALQRGGLLSPAALLAQARRLIADFDVRPADPQLRAAQLSGGNQQKLVLAREVAAAPRLMLVGQPTRGVDIGSIELIHRRLLALRDAGIAILLVSVELEEIRALADRILVMCGGRITGQMQARDFDATRIGLMMGGVATA